MSEVPKPKLAIVDTSTGELKAPGCPQCQALADQLAGAEKERRRLVAENQGLLRNAEAEAREHGRWPEALDLFDWKRVCRKGRSRFNAERFKLVLPFLEKDGPLLCRRAIDGASFDAFETGRKNGSRKRHDGWDLIFRSREKFDEFLARAPKPPKAGELMALAKQILDQMPEDERSTEDRIAQAVGEAQAELRRRQAP